MLFVVFFILLQEIQKHYYPRRYFKFIRESGRTYASMCKKENKEICVQTSLKRYFFVQNMSDIHIWNSSHSFSYRAKLPWTLAILHQHRPRARSNNSLYSEQWPPWRPRPLVLPLQGNWILQRPIGVCTVKNYNAHITRTLVKSTAGLGHTEKYETKYFWVFGARIWITQNSKIKKDLVLL